MYSALTGQTTGSDHQTQPGSGSVYSAGGGSTAGGGGGGGRYMQPNGSNSSAPGATVLGAAPGVPIHPAGTANGLPPAQAPLEPRVFTFGIGPYCNHFFLKQLATIGRGLSDSAFRPHQVQLQIERMLVAAAAPLLSDVMLLVQVGVIVYACVCQYLCICI
jgi:hypothetical protein